MNKRQRENYWRQNIRITRRLEQKYKPSVHKFVKSFTQKFIDNRDSVELMDSDLLGVYAKMYKETVIRFGNEQYRALKTKSFGFNAEWTREVNEYLATEGFRMVTTVSGNLQKVILKIINQTTQEGIENGIGIDEINRLIIERLQEFKESRVSEYIAERIVRTEINRAANIGHMKGAEKHNFQVLKMWISAKDERTRRMPKDQFDHWVLDGQTRELNEPFTQIGKNGQEAIAMQPSDPNAPAGFTINCRCTIAFVPKRDANGRLIPKTNVIAPISSNVPRLANTTPKPVEVPLEQTSGFSLGKNNRETAKNLQAYIINKTGLNINSITIARDLSKDEFDEKAIQLAKLFDEYRINDGLDKDKPVKLSFSSTKRFLGVVKTTNGVTLSGRTIGKSAISEMNFGNKDERLSEVTFVPNSVNTRFSSAIDEKNIKIGVTTHEFAHVMAISSHSQNDNTPDYVKDYFKELVQVRKRYVDEMLALNQQRNREAVYNISLGRYASTNLNEFHAEAFKEYKLSSNPSKYAIEVGRLIDKYFKK